MQKLPSDFSQYIEHNICGTLMLCGDNGDHQLFNIVSNSDGNYTPNCRAKIGPKWNRFCRNNNFQSGRTIRFKFVQNNFDVCHVFILM
jgi:hypothetical protein